MNRTFLAALATRGIVLGSLTLVSTANAVFAPNGYGNNT
jgi:hypothetical protein